MADAAPGEDVRGEGAQAADAHDGDPLVDQAGEVGELEEPQAGVALRHIHPFAFMSWTTLRSQ